MGRDPLEKIAYTVECLLNATRMRDGPERTVPEEWLTKWLHADTTRKNFAIYQKGNLHCYQDGKSVKSFPLRGEGQGQTIWCNGRKISLLDEDAFAKAGKLVMLGTGALIMTMPGTVAANPADAKKKQESNSNN